MADKQPEIKMSEEEQIGFHKGSLSTLAKERQELAKLIQVVEQLMQMHIEALKKLGVDLEKIAKEAQKAGKGKKEDQKPIEDLLK